ncbi:MAG: hypothetical protein WCH40_09775, partial [Verrucomicrobiales bacterium]
MNSSRPALLAPGTAHSRVPALGSQLSAIPSFLRSSLALLAVVFGVWGSNSAKAATPYAMSTGNYSENFASVAGWTANFASGTGAAPYGSVAITTSGTLGDGIKT